MELHGLLQTFPKYVKLFIASFVVVLSIGYSTGLLFVRQTQSVSPDGIEQNYLGNEDIENVKVMKFEKGAREMLTIIHTHILSMSFIFFFLGGLLAMTSIPKRWKAFEKFHLVRSGDTVESVSQNYGLKQKWVISRNKLSGEQSLIAGKKIKLR